MTDYNYYVCDNRQYLVIRNYNEINNIDKKIQGRPDNYMGEFYKWLINIDLSCEIDDIMITYDSDDIGCGYIMPENWKHLLLDELTTKPTIDEIEIFIGELGIRKAFKLADECGYYKEADYKEALSSDEGLRRMFYAILDALIVFNEELTEVDEDEYRINFPESEDDEEDFDEIVPITDEALDRIGGLVARCA